MTSMQVFSEKPVPPHISIPCRAVPLETGGDIAISLPKGKVYINPDGEIVPQEPQFEPITEGEQP